MLVGSVLENVHENRVAEQLGKETFKCEEVRPVVFGGTRELWTSLSPLGMMIWAGLRPQSSAECLGSRTPTRPLTLAKVWTNHQISNRDHSFHEENNRIRDNRRDRIYLKVLPRSSVNCQQMTTDVGRGFPFVLLFVILHTCAREPVLSSAKWDMHSVAVKLCANLH